MRRWLLVLLAMGCGQVVPNDDPDAGGAPPAGFRLVAGQQLGVLPQSTVLQGRDNARSMLVWGKSVWTFGTTVLNKPASDGKNWHTNSFAMTDDLVGNDGVTRFSEKLDNAGTPARILQPTADEAAYNANHAGDACPIAPCNAYYDSRPTQSLWDATRNRVLMFYSLGYLQPGSERRIGQSVAIWSSLDTAPDRPMVAQGEHPTLLFHDKEPAFGAAAVLIDDEIYAFSCEPDAQRFNSPCILAKVRIDDVLVRARWQFWDGNQFASQIENAAEVFTGNWAMSIVHSPYLNRWLAIYAEPLTNVIVARTATELTGPWSDQVPLYKTPAPAPDRWTFDALLHDEYTENGGRTLYLTYSRPNTANGPFGAELIWYRVDIAADE
jgi:Domain of unknown function (DUF4185)